MESEGSSAQEESKSLQVTNPQLWRSFEDRQRKTRVIVLLE